ncbi:MAG: dTMP kinase [Neisseriales bacterium]|nr:MAG: dTMP kinase [Neisseriales bacterium]
MLTHRFITLEGIDGVGKSTHIPFVAQYLIDKGFQVTCTREPGGTRLGEKLRKILLDPSLPLSLDTETLLIFAARAEHIHQVIKPALQKGYWVLSDRFTDATFAYQGGGHCVAFDRIAALANWVQQGLIPALTLLIDIPPNIALARLAPRRRTDRFEQKSLLFYQRVRETYLDLAKQAPQRFIVIDGQQTIEQTQQEITQRLNQYFAQQ